MSVTRGPWEDLKKTLFAMRSTSRATEPAAITLGPKPVVKGWPPGTVDEYRRPSHKEDQHSMRGIHHPSRQQRCKVKSNRSEPTFEPDRKVIGPVVQSRQRASQYLSNKNLCRSNRSNKDDRPSLAGSECFGLVRLTSLLAKDMMLEFYKPSLHWSHLRTSEFRCRVMKSLIARLELPCG